MWETSMWKERNITYWWSLRILPRLWSSTRWILMLEKRMSANIQSFDRWKMPVMPRIYYCKLRWNRLCASSLWQTRKDYERWYMRIMWRLYSTIWRWKTMRSARMRIKWIHYWGRFLHRLSSILNIWSLKNRMLRSKMRWYPLNNWNKWNM